MVSAPRCPPGARGLLALLLLLPLPGARGQCGTLPTLSRAVPRDTSRTEGFPIGTEVTYRCLDGFVKIPGKSDTVVCRSNAEWSTIGEFCGRGCGAIPRLKSAALSAEDATKNYCPPGTTVSYVCRPGYESTELRHVITCLENSTWSEAPEFCRGKSCGVPKGPEHGRAVDTTNYLYGARVNIICDEGFRLRGRPFIQCTLKGDQVEWSQLPTCEVIITQDKPTTVPPKGTEVAGTSSDPYPHFVMKNSIHSVIITQDKPTTVPPKGTEVAGTSSVVITQDKPTTVPPEETEVAGTSSGRSIDTLIVIVIVIVIVVSIIVSMVVNNCTGICAALNKKWKKKKGCYSVNPDSPKHQITTEHDFDMNESKRNLIFKV